MFECDIPYIFFPNNAKRNKRSFSASQTYGNTSVIRSVIICNVRLI